MPGQVTMIPATRDVYTGVPTETNIKRRVAAYARVSTDSEEQLTSYDAQVDYYTKYIQRNPDWKYVETYTDEGISGTSTKKRDGFNNMIADALAGSIDLIITKSVSRFARNTVDSLTTIRKLKEHGVEVFFEKENIYTFDSKGELMLTIMSSLAQEESRSLSQNVTWGQRKRFSDGKVNMHYANFLGYKKGADGKPEIDPDEAKIVRRIYREFLKGESYSSIAESLTSDGILTPGGANKWAKSTIMSILSNEKYKGDALLQKTFTQDFLTKKMKVNEGEVPQYYVTGSHPAIIKPEEWGLVQLEMEKRRNRSYRHTTSNFCGKIICADCGGAFGRKVWHSNDKYKTVVYQCNSKYKKGCNTPHINEETLKDLFIKAYGMLYDDRSHITSDLTELKTKCCDTTALKTKLQSIENDMDLLYSGMQKCVSDNASALISEKEYQEKYTLLKEKYDKRSAEHTRVETSIKRLEHDQAEIDRLIGILKDTAELPMEYDNALFNMVVDKVIVDDEYKVRFFFVGGKEYEFEI